MEVAPSAVALTSLEYFLRPNQDNAYSKYVQERIWDKQLTGLRKKIRSFYKECLDEIELPERFDKNELLDLLLAISSATIHYDKELRNVLIKIGKSYPQHPLSSEKANNFVRALKGFSRFYAKKGIKHNDIYLLGALTSDFPYSLFSDLVLGTYTTSYFYEYRSRATEHHFRNNLLFIRSRSGLRSRKLAIDSYFEMLKPTIKTYMAFLKSKVKLWLLMTIWNSKDIREFMRAQYALKIDKVNNESFKSLRDEYSKNQEELRLLLHRLDPEIFRHLVTGDETTKSMWNDLLQLKFSR